MSFSHSKPRLSERIRGKSGDELFNELRKEFDQDRKSFFSGPNLNNFGSSTGSTFPRAGHLFEEPSMRSHFDIKSHLEDLANRHPEFADQLRYPAWSNDTTRNNTWGRKRRGSDQPELGETSKQTQQQPEESTVVHPPQESEDQPLPRGRPKDNLRNTVPDMGQKQQQEVEDKESRGQRSWSAPPDNRAQQEKPRFVSKIEITPVNPDAPQTQTGDAAKPPMAPPKPQPQSQQQAPQSNQSQPKSNVRHIPIFVEGRDEPVLPKNVEPEFTQSQAHPQQFSRPPPQPQFTHSHHQHQAPPRKQTPPQFDHPPPQPTAPQPPPEPAPPSQPEPPQPEMPKVNPRDPMFQVSCVQKEVDELKSQIDGFNGNSRADKQYILLDELLTRNLIKLDNVDTEGKEEVRAARKNAIKTIQRCISVLENKVPVPGSDGKKTMEMEEQQSDASQGAGPVGDTSVTENNMEVEPQANGADNAVSGGENKEVPIDGEANAKVTSESSENKSA